MQPLFKDAKTYLDGTSEKLFNQGLCVASSTTMTRDDVKYICEVIKESLN
jgi:UDP-N-acetylbacillosamine transaminase